jgi:hypothetical protein
VHVSRLRKALGGGDIVARTPAGYRLRARPGEFDAERFERLVAAGRRALAGGQPEQAAAVLREALSLWRGPPLAELAFEYPMRRVLDIWIATRDLALLSPPPSRPAGPATSTRRSSRARPRSDAPDRRQQRGSRSAAAGIAGATVAEPAGRLAARSLASALERAGASIRHRGLAGVADPGLSRVWTTASVLSFDHTYNARSEGG